MRILTDPFHYVKSQRVHRQHMHKVLQMLSVSGVIRPSYVEPRYVSRFLPVNDHNGQDSAHCRAELLHVVPTRDSRGKQ